MVPVVKVETRVGTKPVGLNHRRPGGVLWPGQAPGPTFSGDLWGNMPFCTFRGDRQLTGAWQPWKFCLKVWGQRCFSSLCWEGSLIITSLLVLLVTLGGYPFGSLCVSRRTDSWDHCLSIWDITELSLCLPSRVTIRPLEMFKDIPRLQELSASWPGVHTWALRAWLSEFLTCPEIILLNKKIVKWGLKGLIFLNVKKCWGFLCGSCVLMMRMKHF